MTNPAPPEPQKKPKSKSWRKHGFEFLSIFVAVISAFALNNWNDNRRDANSKDKILTEIYNGLQKDLQDIRVNLDGHKKGIAACNYFKKAISGKAVNGDSALFHFHYLTRDFVSIQNVAGYETLKSKGLELIENDSLRLQIIGLYEYDYSVLRKLEEEYYEMQFQENYFHELNDILAPHFNFDSTGTLSSIELPLDIDESSKKKALVYLWKINRNRTFIMDYYAQIEQTIEKVQNLISI